MVERQRMKLKVVVNFLKIEQIAERLNNYLTDKAATINTKTL